MMIKNGKERIYTRRESEKEKRESVAGGVCVVSL